MSTHEHELDDACDLCVATIACDSCEWLRTFDPHDARATIDAVQEFSTHMLLTDHPNR